MNTSPMSPNEVTPLEPACEWRRDDLGESYVFQLTDVHLDELDAALVHAETSCDDVLDITRDEFPLPTLGPELLAITRDLINGRGVVLIRGVPVEHYGKKRASSIYWGIGTYLGQPWPQNAKGHLLGDIPGTQEPGCPATPVAMPRAQIQQGQQQRELIGRGAPPGVDHLQQSLREPRPGAALARPGRFRHARIMTRMPAARTPAEPGNAGQPGGRARLSCWNAGSPPQARA